MTERTPEEQRILDDMAAKRGEDYVEEYEELILGQARLLGELPQVDVKGFGYDSDYDE